MFLRPQSEKTKKGTIGPLNPQIKSPSRGPTEKRGAIEINGKIPLTATLA
jgi:hypothetical protein